MEKIVYSGMVLLIVETLIFANYLIKVYKFSLNKCDDNLIQVGVHKGKEEEWKEGYNKLASQNTKLHDALKEAADQLKVALSDGANFKALYESTKRDYDELRKQLGESNGKSNTVQEKSNK